MFSRTDSDGARTLDLAQAALQQIRVFLTRSVVSLVASLLLATGAILSRLFEARGIL